MSKRTAIAALAAALVAGAFAPAPARANVVVNAENAVVGTVHHIGTAIGSIGKKKSNPEREESTQRQNAYKTWFHKKYGYNPTSEQVHEWYVRSYGVDPA
jgi:hypothetical protein